MSAPYSIEPRPDTGLYNGKLGMWFFLAAESMFFGALFSSYAFLRAAADNWPDGSSVLPVGLGLFAAIAGVCAAVASARAWRVAKSGGEATGSLWLIVFSGLIAAACVLYSLEKETLEGMAPATNTFYACWYLISGLIAAHAVAGVGYALWLLWPRAELSPIQLQNRIEGLGLFWQLVALLWFVTFACFYVS